MLDRAIQVHGALGVSDDTPLAAMWRQGCACCGWPTGPDEVHKMVIALRELNRFKPTGEPRRGVSVGQRRDAHRTADRGLTDEQQDFVEAIRDFSEREKLERCRSDDDHSDEVAARWPSSAGGASRSTRSTAARAARSSTRRCSWRRSRAGSSPSPAYGVTLIVVGALNRFGTEEQKQELLGGVAKGGTLAIAMSEPEAGSDVARSRRAPRREDGEWVLNGSKMWSSYAHKASHIADRLPHRRGSSRHEGLSMIFVPRDAEGMTITPIETLGGEETNELHLDNVRVPGGGLLGTEGNGWTQLMAGLNKERVILAAHGARAGAARVRRRARLRQGAQAVRPPDRQLPGARSTGSPTSRPSWPRRGCWCAGSRS